MVANKVVGRMPAGSADPAAARNAMTPVGRIVTEDVLMARNSAMASVAVPGLVHGPVPTVDLDEAALRAEAGVLERVASQALVLSTNITALRQWKREILEKTSLEESAIGEYSGEEKQIRPVTLTTVVPSVETSLGSTATSRSGGAASNIATVVPPPLRTTAYLKHLRWPEPLKIRIDGRIGEAAIILP